MLNLVLAVTYTFEHKTAKVLATAHEILCFGTHHYLALLPSFRPLPACHISVPLTGCHPWASHRLGRRSDIAKFRAESGLQDAAAKHGFILALVEAHDYPGAGRGWSFPGCNASPLLGNTDCKVSCPADSGAQHSFEHVGYDVPW